MIGTLFVVIAAVTLALVGSALLVPQTGTEQRGIAEALGLAWPW